MSRNNNRHSNQNQKPKAEEDASQEEVQETTIETPTVTQEDESPSTPEEGNVDQDGETEDQDSSPEESDSEPTETTEPAPKPAAPKATVSSHLPNQRSGVTAGDYSQAHVDSVIKPTKRFIEIAKDPEAPLNKFNDAKAIMYTALVAAIRYPDAANFIASMNQFLALVKENRETVFHELEFNKYSHMLTLSPTACRDLPRLMCVFMTLAGKDSKNIGKLIDFKSVFTGTMNEAHIERFRSWVLRSA